MTRPGHLGAPFLPVPSVSRPRLLAASVSLACLALLAPAGQAGALSQAPPDERAVAAPGQDTGSAGHGDEPGGAGERGDEHRGIEEQWGIEITSLRLSANGHMLDYRYRVLDAAKASDLFKRQIKPYLIHQPTGKVLAVPETAKLGPLRNSNIPQEGRIYWMFFGNAGKIVQPGDKVTVVIGKFRVEDIVVE